tara:strand:+ start:2845 stop:3744 length:900 start_codon:yes stop_codon:yes gene_type:complete
MKKANYILLFLFTILHLKNSAQNVKKSYQFNSDCDILHEFFCNDSPLNDRNLNVILINSGNLLMLNSNYVDIISLRGNIDKILREYNFRNLESIKTRRPFFLIAFHRGTDITSIIECERAILDVYSRHKVKPKYRNICNMTWEEYRNSCLRPQEPPPPPPPEIIEIVEDEVEIEEETVVNDVDDEYDLDLEEDDDEVYIAVEEMPQFPGGDFALMKYIASYIRYPQKAKEYGIQGKVFVSFVIDKKGKVKDVKVIKGVEKSLDEAAKQVIESLPKFTPGRQRGKAVRVQLTIPINFKLN